MSTPTPPIDDDGGLDEFELDDVDDDVGLEPNYLIRRAIVIAAALVALVGGGYLIAQLVGNDDTTSTTVVDADWNTVVLIDERTGEVVLVDPNGEEVERFTTGLRQIAASDLVGTTLVVDNGTELAVIDLSDTSAAVEPLPFDADRTAGVSRPNGTTLTMVSGTQDRAVLIHGPSGEVVDTSDFATVAGAQYVLDDALSNPTGRDVLLADAGNFQSVLLSFDRDEPSYFPGVPLAVGTDVVVTAQTVGAKATISVFDHDGAVVSTATTDAVRAGLVDGDNLVVTTVNGKVIRIEMATGTSKPSDAIEGDVTVESSVVSAAGDRLAVVSDGGVSIVDGEGRVLTTVADSSPLHAGSTCLMLARADTGELVVVGWADGAVVAEAAAEPTSLVTADGCTLVDAGAVPPVAISADGVVDIEATGDPVGLSPDGERLVVDGRRMFLTDLAGTDPIDIGPTGRVVLFAQI